jgi:small conductance mechanosensitive channel
MLDTSRILLIVAIVVGVHLTVLLVRKAGTRLLKAWPKATFTKARSIASLLTSAAIFFLYFAAVGMVLRKFGVSLTAYLASASVLGLAIGFGSQGLVQDVVTGLTVIFSDLIHVDDMVEIGGQTGIVQNIGMRFITLKNYLGAEVYIPNRTVTAVVNYPRGYIRCLIDVILAGDHETADRMEQKAKALMQDAAKQFGGISIREPSLEGRIQVNPDKQVLRLKFRIWPGRGAVLETAVRQEIVHHLKQIDAGFSDWMVAVNYEVEKRVTVSE